MNTATKIQELHTTGITILKKYVPEELCDAIQRDFYKFCENSTEEIWTENNKHSRLYNLHLQSTNILHLLFNDGLMQLLDEYFETKTALNSTIYFEEGSQQCIHRDTPYFWSHPYEGKFVGVWFALEDTTVENGKLEYYPFGHTIPVDPVDFANQYDKNVDSHTLFDHFGEAVEKLCIQRGFVKESQDIRKGDIVIWHADLPHGGSPIVNKSLTRHSLVAHYLPEGAYVQLIDNFFGRTEPKSIMSFVDTIKNRKMRNVTLTSFAKNSKCNRDIK